MVYPETIQSLGVIDYDDYLHPKRFEHTPQKLRDYDVDIKIDCCGVCGSDVHAASGDWGRPYAPVAFGHEIIGTIVKLGPNAKKGFKLGDRVGVGAQCDADGTCRACQDHHENNCDNNVSTYFSVYPETNIPTIGGNSSHIRVNSKFVFKIPDALESIYAAPLLCGGVTGFAPLLQNKINSSHRVGVVGIGGIGHMTILFAKALGCEVTAISRGYSKQEDAKKLGADHYVATSDPESVKAQRKTLDIIVNTGSSFSGNSLDTLLSLLKARGTFSFITAPPITEKLEVNPMTVLMSNYRIHGSAIGSPAEVEYTLEFAAKHNIKPWIETLDINEENLGTAWSRMEKGDVRYRITMTGYDKYFKQ